MNTETGKARDLREQLKKWPKIDLHRHLEGSLRLETLSEIALEHGIDLPGYDVDTIRPYVQITNEPRTHQHFLAKFRMLRRFFCSRQVVERIAYEAVADAAADNVRYFELRFTPKALSSVGDYALEEVVQWVIGAVRRAERDHSVRANLIISMNRHEELALGWETAELALQYRDDIVGLDLAGDEVAFSARPFAPIFQRAKDAGLGITIHAGEWKGSENVVESITHLCADRVGHGVRAIENPAVVRLLRQRGTALEICPTSNLQSGAVPGVDQHPLTDLMELGLNITINTDDPGVSNIELTDEYHLAVHQLGLSLENLKRTILNAARSAFLPVEDKEELVEWFGQALAAYDDSIG